MADNQLQGASGAMIPENLTKFVAALKQVSLALDTLGDLFGYTNKDVEAIRSGYFGLYDQRMDLDPEWAAGQRWTVPQKVD